METTSSATKSDRLMNNDINVPTMYPTCTALHSLRGRSQVLPSVLRGRRQNYNTATLLVRMGWLANSLGRSSLVLSWSSLHGCENVSWSWGEMDSLTAKQNSILGMVLCVRYIEHRDYNNSRAEIKGKSIFF